MCHPHSNPINSSWRGTLSRYGYAFICLLGDEQGRSLTHTQLHSREVLWIVEFKYTRGYHVGPERRHEAAHSRSHGGGHRGLPGDHTLDVGVDVAGSGATLGEHSMTVKSWQSDIAM